MKTNDRALILTSAPPASARSAASTNIASLNLRGVKDPVAISNPWLWLIWGAAALAMAAALFYWWRRQKRVVQAPTKITPAHVRAREKLRDALKFIDQPYPFCAAVSDAVREYLEERFNFRAPERTTEEFLIELQTSPLLNSDQKEWLAQFLGTCDMVKFARLEPSQAELQALHHAASRLVDQTEPGLAEVSMEPKAAAS